MTDQAGQTNGGTEPLGRTSSSGVVRGVIGSEITEVGVLDLRGVPTEQLQLLRRIKDTGVVLIDEGQRGALANCSLESVGVLVEATPAERALVQPLLELNRATVEGMPPGQRFTMVGMLHLRQDIPPALLAEKIESLRLVGPLLISSTLLGALFGRLDHIGPTTLLSDVERPLVRNSGDTRLTPGYLSQIAPGTEFINMGRTEVTPEVTGALLRQAFAAYHNLGMTVGNTEQVDTIRALCISDFGSFEVIDPTP